MLSQFFDVDASTRKRTSMAVVVTQTSPTMKHGQSLLGLCEGTREGVSEGSSDGVFVGDSDGNSVGMSVQLHSTMRSEISRKIDPEA